MKSITIILFIIISGMLCFCLIKGCDSKPSDLEQKASESLHNDSVVSIKAVRAIQRYDSLIKVKQYEDSLHKEKIASLSKDYNTLRAIVRGFKVVKVDSSNQIVNVPVIAYNASIEQGDMCDSLIMYLDKELAIKDSIISYRTLQYESCDKMNDANEQALRDQIALNMSNKHKLKKSETLNKKIPLVATIAAVAGYVLATILIK